MGEVWSPVYSASDSWEQFISTLSAVRIKTQPDVCEVAVSTGAAVRGLVSKATAGNPWSADRQEAWLCGTASAVAALATFSYAPIPVSGVHVVTVSFEIFNFIFQIFPFFVLEMSTSFSSLLSLHLGPATACFLRSTDFEHSPSDHGF